MQYKKYYMKTVDTARSCLWEYMCGSVILQGPKRYIVPT
jgi:hypothetical protein